MSRVKIAGLCEGFPDVRHVDCGGGLLISGEGWIRLPHGVGLVSEDGETKIVTDAAEYQIYTGFCEKCRVSGDFVRRDVRARRRRKVVRKRN